MTTDSPILILGMHRSGTSCLTGCLEEAGLYLGDVNTYAGFNKKGNRENLAIMKLHDEILARVGARWDNPPSRSPIWLQDELSTLKTLLGTYPKDAIWGTKDPRVLLVMKGWFELCDPKFIGTFRHPVEVVNSLQHRAKAWGQQMDKDHAYNLWKIYNTHMLAIYHKTPFDIIRFDIEPAQYQVKLKKAGQRLGLAMPKEFSFLDAVLKNQSFNQYEVPDHLNSLWDELNDVAI